MPKLYQTKIWQASLPDGWEARTQYFDCATFFKPDGIGDIFVLVCPAEQEGPKPDPESHQQFGKLKGSSSEHRWSRTFTRSWWLSCKGRLLLAKYTCALSFADVERHEVDEILQSMEESDAPAA